uniref:MICOS complex subunit MIC10 n=1 Tax=Gasterosteus aculeatus aculeatus TaxID=481459 RepID=A0AAQ4PE86_GASAC
MAAEHGRKWDRCLADTAVKTVTGLAVGVVFSVVLFKRRTWPVSLGSGLGLGMGYANCQHDFRSPYLVHGDMVKVSGEGEMWRVTAACDASFFMMSTCAHSQDQ